MTETRNRLLEGILDRNYIVLSIDNPNRTSCQWSLVIFGRMCWKKTIRGQFSGRSLLQKLTYKHITGAICMQLQGKTNLI
jgi:hypothetical protein